MLKTDILVRHPQLHTDLLDLPMHLFKVQRYSYSHCTGGGGHRNQSNNWGNGSHLIKCMDLFCTSSSSSSSSQDSHSEAANAIEVSCYSSVSEITWKIQKYLKPSKSITCHFTCSAWQINCMTGWWDYCSPSTSHITKPQLGCRVQVAHQEIQRTDRERELSTEAKDNTVTTIHQIQRLAIATQLPKGQFKWTAFDFWQSPSWKWSPSYLISSQQHLLHWTMYWSECNHQGKIFSKIDKS